MGMTIAELLSPKMQDIETFTKDVVQEGIESAQDKSASALDAVRAITEQIGNALASITDIGNVDVQMGEPSMQIGSFVIPDAPDRPTFEDAPATITLAQVAANFPEQEAYVSDLLTTLKAKLTSLVLNLEQTGLNPEIEQQIWDRARQRTTAAMQSVVDNVTRMHARAGWAVPTGDEIEKLYQAMEDKAKQDVEESRNIAIAQADLEQKNFQFSVTQGIALETMLANIFDALQRRYFESEKVRVETEVAMNTGNAQIYESNIKAFSAKTGAISDVYKADASVYESIIDGQAKKISAEADVVKTQVSYLSEKAKISIQALSANISSMLAQKELTLGTLKTIAQIWTSLAASFGSSVNYSAGVHAGMSQSESQSYSSSASVSDSTVHYD